MSSVKDGDSVILEITPVTIPRGPNNKSRLRSDAMTIADTINRKKSIIA